MNIYILNLSKSLNFSAYKNIAQIGYKESTFPAGEEHIRLDTNSFNDNSKVIITSTMKNSSDIMKLFLASDALRRARNNLDIELFLPYIPYARQDRVMTSGESLSIKVFSDLINNQNYSRVHVFDPHSDVSVATLNRINIIDNKSFIFYSLYNIINEQIETYNNKNTCFISPDLGAYKKINNILGISVLSSKNHYYGNKVRNMDTGKIQHYELSGNVKDKICIVSDDIIDGGATIMKLAESLKNQGAKKIFLIISHGIFSQGVNMFMKYVDKIYITNSFNNKEKLDDKYDLINVYSLEKEILRKEYLNLKL